MRKEDKSAIIDQTWQSMYVFKFLFDRCDTMNSVATSALKKMENAIKSDIKMVVVKNSLKAFENVEGDFSPLFNSLKGNDSCFFCNVANAP